MTKWKTITLVVVAVLVAGVLTAGSAAYLLLRRGAPEEADFCSVVLIPELAEEIGADLPTRIQLAATGRILLVGLSGNIGPQKLGPMSEERGKRAIAECGTAAKDLLTSKQRRAFERRFRWRQLVPVTYREQGPAGSGKQDQPFLTFGWKKLGKEALQRSYAETQSGLNRVFEIIPSEAVALELLEHSHDFVNSAAAQWLNKHSTAHAGVKSRAAQRLAAKHQASIKAMREESAEWRKVRDEDYAERGRKREEQRQRRQTGGANHAARREQPPMKSYEERVKAQREKQEALAEQPREKQARGPAGETGANDPATAKQEPRRLKPYEERVKESRAEFEARVKKMQARHEERLRQLREQSGQSN